MESLGEKKMEIKKIEENDYKDVIGLIREEFPYISFDIEKIKKRIETGKIFLFKATEKENMLGFIELEIFEEGMARINGLTVKEKFRNNGIAKKLLEHSLDFLKNKGVKRILLLVKQKNDPAKKLYKEAGFSFIGMYHRELDDTVVEEMELDVSKNGEEDLSYVG